jgi:sister chromatid cohesion protein DCC1
LGNHLLCRFFELFFNTAILEDWNLMEEPLNFENVWKCFQQYEDEFSQSLADFILQFYSNGVGKFDFIKASRFLAEQLLCARLVWDQEDFVAAWEKSLNDLYTPEMDNIKDLLLTERHPGSGRLEIKRYFRSDLPSDVESRFIALFKTRSRWQYEELIPFISDLGRDSKELDAIVLKHGRISTTKDVKFITPRSQLLD